MADITATDVLHQMKNTQKGTHHHHNEHGGTAGSSDSNSVKTDLEKHASHGAGYDMSGIPVEDGEYVVTAKTWAVVIVLALSYGVSFWPVPYFSTIQTQMATQFGSPTYGTW